jgi:exodeoxyribonuclease VII large subunit
MPSDDFFLREETPAPPSIAGSTPELAFSVSTLTGVIRDVLEESLGQVWVAGEISNFRNPGSGHLYFTLKDASATLSAVMFRNDAARLNFPLRDGLAVIARGNITVYEARGQYQIQVEQLRPRGQGSLQEKFEALKRKLGAEGLFDPARKRGLPVFPETIGIVTSLQGAVLQDFTRILKRRAPGIRILVRGVRVQGEGAAQEIADAISAFNRENTGDKAVEVIVIARGGGSLEDLWQFNEEIVARAIAASDIPTISAVGHETDFTIADFVADLRAPTPSAAAELVSREWKDWREEVGDLSKRMERAVLGMLRERRSEWERLRQSYVFREPGRVIAQMQQRVDDLTDLLRSGLQHGVEERRHELDKLSLRWAAVDPRQVIARQRERLSQWEARLRTLGPAATLQRGYALVLDRDGRIIREAKPSQVGNAATVRLAKGSLHVHIDKTLE